MTGLLGDNWDFKDWVFNIRHCLISVRFRLVVFTNTIISSMIIYVKLLDFISECSGFNG